MSFVDIILGDDNSKVANNLPSDKTSQNERVAQNERDEQPVDILRRAGFKIKLVTATSFGTQIDFVKQYDEDEIRTVLTDYAIKFKGNSIFIIE